MSTATFANTMRVNSARAVPVARWIAELSDRLSRWLDATRSRHALDELDGHLLRDIGLTREEAQREARKFFWQA